MKFKNKKGFITVYVLISMIFLITIITISLIRLSAKARDQEQINSQIYNMYIDGENKEIIATDITEIPIYTKEQFEYLREWIKNASREINYMLIEEMIYKLDPGKVSQYKAILKTDLYLEYEFDTSEFEVIKNGYEIIDYYVAYVYNINGDNSWSKPIYNEKEIPEGDFTYKFYKRKDNSIITEEYLKYETYIDTDGDGAEEKISVDLPIEVNDCSYKLVIKGKGDMPSLINLETDEYIGYQSGINKVLQGERVIDNLLLPYVKEVEISEGITSIGVGTFFGAYYIKNMEQINIPKTVTKIDERAFSFSGIEELLLPEEIEISSIGLKAFEGCNFLEKINMPTQVTIIEKGMFLNCDALKKVVISENIKEIRERAFYDNDELQVVVINKNVEKIGDVAFAECEKLSKIYIEIEDRSKVETGSYIFERAADGAEIYARTEDFSNIGSGINSPQYIIGNSWSSPK